jgi:hypothetical protein
VLSHLAGISIAANVRFATVARLPLGAELFGSPDMASVLSCRPTLVLLTLAHVEPGGSQCKARHFLLQ